MDGFWRRREFIGNFRLRETAEPRRDEAVRRIGGGYDRFRQVGVVVIVKQDSRNQIGQTLRSEDERTPSIGRNRRSGGEFDSA